MWSSFAVTRDMSQALRLLNSVGKRIRMRNDILIRTFTDIILQLIVELDRYIHSYDAGWIFMYNGTLKDGMRIIKLMIDGLRYNQRLEMDFYCVPSQRASSVCLWKLLWFAFETFWWILDVNYDHMRWWMVWDKWMDLLKFFVRRNFELLTVFGVLVDVFGDLCSGYLDVVYRNHFLFEI